MKRFLAVALLAAVAGTVEAQNVRTVAPAKARAFSFDEPNSARIGIYLGANDRRDTLGVLVESLFADGPAAKAGIKDGDRVQSIDGVNLKMSREDADDEVLRGMMNRRLTRELDKKKAGDEVDLRVYSGGSARSVRVKTVAARELTQNTLRASSPTFSRFADRAAIGISLGGRATRRDTAGVLVTSVTPDGPAEKAGIIEGDRIARINGQDLRVPQEDAGEPELSQARIRRLNNELNNLKAGDAATLTVVTAGRSREVRVTAVKASELNDGFQWFFGGDGHLNFTPNVIPNINFPEFRLLPRGGRALEMPELFSEDGLRFYWDGNGDVKFDVRERVQKALEAAREITDRARESVERARLSPSRVTIRS